MSGTTKAAIAAAGMAASLFAYASAGDGAEKESMIAATDVFGRVMFDYAYADGKNTPFTVNETELRWARVGAQVKFSNGAKLKVELNTNDSGDVTVTDAYLVLGTGFEQAKVQIGQFKTPNSFDEATSSRFMSILERAAFTDAFDLDRRVGVAVTGKSDRHTYMLGVFGENIHDDATFGGYAVAGRATFSPNVNAEDTVIHTGVSFRYRDADADQLLFRYRQRPFTHIPGRIVGTERITGLDVLVGVETAVVKGSFWAAGEYALTFATRTANVHDPTFSGGYLETGFMCNGRRTIKDGKFDRPEFDDGRLGAASLALRFDSLDLTDAAVNGGSYRSITMAADWWPKEHLRIGLNGFIANAELGATPSGLDPVFSDAVSTGVTKETVKGVVLRAQFDFSAKLR